MKIQIIGGGVIGQISACVFKEGGHDVVLAARGQRLMELDRNGIRLNPLGKGMAGSYRVQLSDEVSGEHFDLAVAAVRREQLDTLLQDMGVLARDVPVLFFMNCASNITEVFGRLKGRSAAWAFPGFGGSLVQGAVRYGILDASQQPTTLPLSFDGHDTLLTALETAFRRARFPVARCADMDSWLKTHAAWTVPAAGALYRAALKGRTMLQEPDTISAMIDGIREAYSILASRGAAITPKSLEFWKKLPRGLLAWMDRFILARADFQATFVAHTMANPAEFAALGKDLMGMAQDSGLEVPILRSLIDNIRQYGEMTGGNREN